jgi:hypothetical protein
MTNAPILTAEAIIFAINSAIRLSRTIRKAYARSIKGRLLVLPLPEFDPSLDLITVVEYFRRNDHHLKRLKELKILHDRAFNEPNFRGDKRAFQRYQEYFFALNSRKGPPEITQDDITHLLAVRQWEHGVEAPGSVLQLVAGTVVELGIDYFLQVPGAINPNSAKGKVLREFLEAFDQIDFSENRQVKRTLSERLVPGLFAAAAESIAELSPNITRDDKLQLFIHTTAKGIASDLYKKLEHIPDPYEQEKVIHWGQVVTRSLIKNAGTIAFSNPAQLFDTNTPASRIIAETGGIVLEAILDDSSDAVYLKKAISQDTLDRIVQASLEVVSAHPNVINGKQGIKSIIAGVASAMQDKSLFEQGYFPEFIRLVLEQSAGHLPVLWDTDEGEHLLVLALQQILEVITVRHANAPWRPGFTKEDMVDLVHFLLDEVVQNPDWILDSVDQDPILTETLDISLRSLKHIDKKSRLKPDVLRWLLRLNIQAVATNRSLLKKLKWTANEEEISILEQALRLLFNYVFPADADPNVSTTYLLVDLTEYLLGTLLQKHPNRKGLVLLDLILFESGLDYDQAFNEALLDELTQASLAAIANHPEYITDHQALKSILAGVASTIEQTGIRQEGLMVFMVQTILNHSAANVHLIIRAKAGQARHLLLTASTIILDALAAKDGSGNWRPEISRGLAMTLIEELLDETVRYPHWVKPRPGKHPLLKEILDITFWTLEKLDKDKRLSPEVLELLIQLNIRTVLNSPQVLDVVKWSIGHEQKAAILEHALNLVFSYVFPEEGTGEEERAQLLASLLEYTLGVILQKYPDEKGLILIGLILSESNGLDYRQGFNEELASQLTDAALQVLQQHPHLLTNEETLQHIIAEIANTVANSGLPGTALLPEIIRIILEQSAEHLDLLFDTDEESPRHLLVIATEQTLAAIAQKPTHGKWKPKLTNEQILDLLDTIYAAVLANPQWVDKSPLVFILLEAIFKSLEVIPPRRKLAYDSLRYLIQYALEAVSQKRQLLLKMRTGPQAGQEIRIGYSLRSVFMIIYNEHNAEEARWYLSQADIIDSLIDYFFLLISEGGASEAELEKAAARIGRLLDLWGEDFRRSLQQAMHELDASEY